LLKGKEHEQKEIEKGETKREIKLKIVNKP
jgi:hypothetical protein